MLLEKKGSKTINKGDLIFHMKIVCTLVMFFSCKQNVITIVHNNCEVKGNDSK